MKLEACSTIIFIDPSLTYIDNEQVEDRLLPTTKEVAINKNKQQIIHLVVKDTIDEYIQVMLDNKKTKVQIINNFKNTLG
jgi:DNA repair exonuclease SbcCD nuclease subunit